MPHSDNALADAAVMQSMPLLSLRHSTHPSSWFVGGFLVAMVAQPQIKEAKGT